MSPHAHSSPDPLPAAGSLESKLFRRTGSEAVPTACSGRESTGPEVPGWQFHASFVAKPLSLGAGRLEEGGLGASLTAHGKPSHTLRDDGRRKLSSTLHASSSAA